MSKVIWDKSYSVGNSSIDEEHKELIRIINKLDSNTHSADLNLILEELTDYIGYHFSNEEELLEKAHYSELNKHRKQHTQFIERVDFLMQELIEGKTPIEETKLFLSQWLIEHIMGVDQQYKGVI